MKGWIKLHRSVLDNDIYRFDPTAWRIFQHLLLNVDSKKGSCTYGRKQLSLQMGNNENTTYKALQRLKSAKMVTLASNNRFTVIRICKWSEYQGNGNSPSNNEVTTGEQPSNNEVTHYKKEEARNKNKENTTNVVLAKPEFGNTHLNEMFKYWEDTTGLPVTAQVKANRFAANNLLKKYGVDKLRQLIDGVALAGQDEYAPRIANFSQLQRRADDLILWGRKKGTINKVAKIR